MRIERPADRQPDFAGLDWPGPRKPAATATRRHNDEDTRCSRRTRRHGGARRAAFESTRRPARLRSLAVAGFVALCRADRGGTDRPCLAPAAASAGDSRGLAAGPACPHGYMPAWLRPGLGLARWSALPHCHTAAPRGQCTGRYRHCQQGLHGGVPATHRTAD